MGSSVLIIKLLMVTSHFGRIFSIWCFNDMSFSSISLCVSVIVLFVSTWIITFCNSSPFLWYLQFFHLEWLNKYMSFVLNSLLSSMSFNMESPAIKILFFFYDFLLFSFWFLICYYHLTCYLWFSHFLW